MVQSCPVRRLGNISYPKTIALRIIGQPEGFAYEIAAFRLVEYIATCTVYNGMLGTENCTIIFPGI